jgi:nitrite reductase (NADH) small subunit
MTSTPVPDVKPPATGEAVKVVVGGKGIAIFNVAGTLRAIESRCPHVGGPLEKGIVEGGGVTCPWHGSEFDLTTGAVRRGPATKGVASYPVRIEAGTMVLEFP